MHTLQGKMFGQKESSFIALTKKKKKQQQTNKQTNKQKNQKQLIRQWNES